MSKTTCVWESGLAREFWQNGRLPFTVYDVHGHMGLHPAIYMSHAAPETMVRHLRRAGAKLIFTHHYALNDWTFRNAQCVEIARRFPDDLRPSLKKPRWPSTAGAGSAALQRRPSSRRPDIPSRISWAVSLPGPAPGKLFPRIRNRSGHRLPAMRRSPSGPTAVFLS